MVKVVVWAVRDSSHERQIVDSSSSSDSCCTAIYMQCILFQERTVSKFEYTSTLANNPTNAVYRVTND